MDGDIAEKKLHSHDGVSLCRMEALSVKILFETESEVCHYHGCSEKKMSLTTWKKILWSTWNKAIPQPSCASQSRIIVGTGLPVV